jgi:hypothetical protein
METTTTIDGIEYRNVQEWGNYLLGMRNEYGSAAHGNRGKYSGAKVHRVVSKYVVGVIDQTKETRQDTFGAKFLKTGKPQLFSCRPACGCTSGQHAARPDSRFTSEHVNCSKCA